MSNNNVKKTNFGLFVAQFIFNLVVTITSLVLLIKVIKSVVSTVKGDVIAAAGSLLSGSTLITFVIFILALVILMILSLVTLFYFNNHSEMKGLVISNGVIGLIGGLFIVGTITSLIIAYKIKKKSA